MLTSGRTADAMAGLQEWLDRAAAALEPGQPVRGDLDTVAMLVQQLKVYTY